MSSRVGGVPPRARPAESAIEKQLASAAASSSSGLVPADASSARARHEIPTSVAAPLPSENVPEPPVRSPFQVALALWSIAIVRSFVAGWVRRSYRGADVRFAS